MSNRPKKKVQYGTPAPTAPSGSGSAMGPKIAVGAILVAIVIAIIVAAVNDGTAGDSALDPSSNVAFQSATIDGESLPGFPDSADSQVPTNDPAIGATIPTITGKSFDGSKIVIKPGKPQLIAVVAHWCPHCQAEVPLLVEWMDSGVIPDDVEVVAVSTAAEEAKGNFPPASWLQKEGWTPPVLVDTPKQAVMNSLGVSGFPTLIAVDADGKVTKRGSGELTEAQVKELAESALGKATDGTVTTDDDTTTKITTTTAAP